MSILERRELVKQNAIQRLFKKLPVANYLIELNNSIVEYENNLLDYPLSKCTELKEKYKIKKNEHVVSEKERIANLFLDYYLTDEIIDEKEIAQINILRQILEFNDSKMKKLLDDKARILLSRHIDTALEDKKIEDGEMQKLDLIRKNLLLSEETLNEMYTDSATNILQNYLDQAVSDQRLSPEEDKQLEELSTNLGIGIKTDEKTKEILNRYRLYWRIENADIPTCSVSISLQKNEACYFSTHIKWLEQRRVTKRINYSGPTMRIRIMKGVYWRAGSIAPQRISEDEWRVIDEGTIYLTNKRIIFMGNNGNKTITLGKILGFEPYSNGVDIQKDSGKSPFLEFSTNIDIFSMILARVLNEK